MTPARRFFVEGAREAGAAVQIGGGDAHKIVHVLRLREGDRIEVIDSTARTFVASIDSLGPIVMATLAEAIEPEGVAGRALRIDVAQALPKGRRMEFVVEKGTELGVAAFLPFYCERSVRRGVGGETLARWQRIARGAAQQCGRSEVPNMFELRSFEALVAHFAEYDAVLFAWELAQPAALYERLHSVLPAAGRALVVIGPEGGFTHAEAEAAAREGATLLWLGPRVLRTDTAALVLLAVIGAFAS